MKPKVLFSYSVINETSYAYLSGDIFLKVIFQEIPGFPLEFLHLEELLMTYRSVHVVIGASARALRCARGLIFSVFHRHPIFVGVCQRNH